jgi:hypothetical protein
MNRKQVDDFIQDVMSTTTRQLDSVSHLDSIRCTLDAKTITHAFSKHWFVGVAFVDACDVETMEQIALPSIWKKNLIHVYNIDRFGLHNNFEIDLVTILENQIPDWIYDRRNLVGNVEFTVQDHFLVLKYYEYTHDVDLQLIWNLESKTLVYEKTMTDASINTSVYLLGYHEDPSNVTCRGLYRIVLPSLHHELVTYKKDIIPYKGIDGEYQPLTIEYYRDFYFMTIFGCRSRVHPDQSPGPILLRLKDGQILAKRIIPVLPISSFTLLVNDYAIVVCDDRNGDPKGGMISLLFLNVFSLEILFWIDKIHMHGSKEDFCVIDRRFVSFFSGGKQRVENFMMYGGDWRSGPIYKEMVFEYDDEEWKIVKTGDESIAAFYDRVRRKRPTIQGGVDGYSFTFCENGVWQIDLVVLGENSMRSKLLECLHSERCVDLSFVFQSMDDNMWKSFNCRD